MVHEICNFSTQGAGGALAVLMRDAIRPNLMQTLEVSFYSQFMCTFNSIFLMKEIY